MKRFAQGEWRVWVYDDKYTFAFGPRGNVGFAATYEGKCAEYIDEAILRCDVIPWARRVTNALCTGPEMELPDKLVREVECHVRANWEWEY